MQTKVPNGLTWTITRAITITLNPIVHKCILNQTHEYLHLSNALVITILILVKLQVEEQCSSINVLGVKNIAYIGCKCQIVPLLNQKVGHC
jgi:uncharacterized membrane protein